MDLDAVPALMSEQAPRETSLSLPEVTQEQEQDISNEAAKRTDSDAQISDQQQEEHGGHGLGQHDASQEQQQVGVTPIKPDLVEDNSEDEDFQVEAEIGAILDQDEDADEEDVAKREPVLGRKNDAAISETDTSAESSSDEEEDEDEEYYDEAQFDSGGHFLLDASSGHQQGNEQERRFEDRDFTWDGGDDWWVDPKVRSSRESAKVEVKEEEKTDSKAGIKRRQSEEHAYKKGHHKRRKKAKVPDDLADFIDDSFDEEDEGSLDDDGDEEEWDSDSDSSYKAGGAAHRRGKGRGRPRKRRKIFAEDDPMKDWDVKTEFECHRCKEGIRGFQRAVDHMDAKHPLLGGEKKSEEESFQCPLCPKLFGRKDHLKRHVEGHVEGRIPYGGEVARRRRKRMLMLKRSKMEAEADGK